MSVLNKSSRIQRGFDARAGRYDNPLTAFIGERELRQVRPLVPSGSYVLDYGCGTGRTTLDLLQRGCRVTAYDISTGMLTIANAKALQAGFCEEKSFLDSAGSQVEFTADAALLQGRRWPYVTLIGVLDYYPKPDPILRLVSHYLGEDGRLVVTFPNALSPLGWLYALGSRFTIPAIPRTPAFAQAAAWRAGLRVTDMRFAYPAIAPFGHTIILALEKRII